MKNEYHIQHSVATTSLLLTVVCLHQQEKEKKSLQRRKFLRNKGIKIVCKLEALHSSSATKQITYTEAVTVLLTPVEELEASNLLIYVYPP